MVQLTRHDISIAKLAGSIADMLGDQLVEHRTTPLAFDLPLT